MSLSRTKKIELIRSINDENFFRTEILIPIYQNMGCFEQVIDNHGANERGTDIVLVDRGPFRTYRYTSVIVKVKKINNATTGRDTASNVIQQIIAARTNGYFCSIQNKHVKFNSILIVTSQEISSTARDSLGNYSQSNGEVETAFLTANDLLSLIDEYLPDFYFYRSGLHAQLATALRQKCEMLNELANLPQFTVKERALVDIFVKPQLRHVESRFIEGKQDNRIIFSTAEEVFSTYSRVLLIGDAGSGKTVTLRETVLNALADNTRNKTPSFPLLVKANDIAKCQGIDLENILNEVVRKYYNLPDFDLGMLEDTKTILLVDGMDEIVDPDRRECVRQLILDYGNRNRDIGIVVTSRFTKDLAAIDTMVEYKRWDVLPFNLNQVTLFITKWFENREEQSRRLLTALEDHDLLSRLPNTPLVLTLLAILFDSDDYREIPSNLSELYRMFLDLMLGRWSLDRRVETMYDANMREFFAVEFALSLHRKGSTSATKEEFQNVVQHCSQTLGFQLDGEQLFSDLVEQTALIYINDKEELEFKHLSFQEFLVALRVFKSGQTETKEFLIEKAVDPWWSQVLYFYCGLRQDNPDVLQALIAKMPQYEPAARLIASLNLGYLIQTSYHTDVRIRRDAVEAAIRAYYTGIDSIDMKVEKLELPEGLVFVAFVMWLSVAYSSVPLKPVYWDLLNTLNSDSPLDGETAFLVVALATFLAQTGDHRALSEAHEAAKSDPRYLLALAEIGQMILDEIPAGTKRKGETEDLKGTVKKIIKWFKDHPEITKLLTKTRNKPLLN